MAQADKQKTAKGGEKGKSGVSRRSFLVLSASAVAAGFLPMISVRAVAGAVTGNAEKADASIPAAPDMSYANYRRTPPSPFREPGDFRYVSGFLTGKRIMPNLSARAWWALVNNDANFPEKYAPLREFVMKSGRGTKVDSTIDTVKDRPEFTGSLRQVAMTIISAYYLGYVGAPKALRAHDDTIFITFSQALMYQANSDMAPINSYSRWHSGYWVSAVNKS